MELIALGRSGLQVSPIAYGTWQLGGDWGPTDETEAKAAVRKARDVGINFFDTAQAYGFGASERLLGEALRDDLQHHRDDVVIATKGGLRIANGELLRDSSPEWLRQGVDESLAALGVDYIDLYQIHWPDDKVPYDESAGALQELVDSGKIRHVGVSNFDSEQITAMAKRRPVETLQPPYHLFRRGIEEELLPFCLEDDIGVLAYSPLASGLLTGAMSEDATFHAEDWRGRSPVYTGEGLKTNVGVVRELESFAKQTLDTSVSQLALAWVLSHPAVHVAIVGSRSAKHIAEAVKAPSIKLSDDDLAQIDKIMAAAVAVGGPTPEGF